MRKPIIAGNWKMNMNPKETAEFVNASKATYLTLSKLNQLSVLLPLTYLLYSKLLKVLI
jgi:triosephosphate isomerase